MMRWRARRWQRMARRMTADLRRREGRLAAIPEDGITDKWRNDALAAMVEAEAAMRRAVEQLETDGAPPDLIAQTKAVLGRTEERTAEVAALIEAERTLREATERELGGASFDEIVAGTETGQPEPGQAAPPGDLPEPAKNGGA